ncbi:MAG: GDSL family lipase [Deltaproteobacteria bacterium]|nr:GDSL family lipase [Deltaproteobacteria bacterium]
MRPRRGARVRRVAIAVFGIGLLGCEGADSLQIGAAIEPLHGSRYTELDTALAADETNPAFLRRHAEINSLPDRDRIELVFLGDSITQRWESAGRFVWNQRYAGRGGANFGIDGDRTQNVLWRIEHGNFDGMRPLAVVLLIGTNNTYEASDADVVRGVLAVVDMLHAQLPETRILVLGLLPRNRNPNAHIRARIGAINAQLAERAPRPRVAFLDIGATFLEPDGTLSAEVMPDALHLGPRGYTLWAEAIEPSLSCLLANLSPPC